MITKIISGGQTGADRAGLDFAIQQSLPYGGWVPKGRKSEDGTIPEAYQLQEMPTSDYSRRTEKNVLDSDGTLIVSHGMLTGGSAMTEFYAEQHQKPCLHIDLDQMSIEEATLRIKAWLEKHSIRILNVAGPRAGKDPKIYPSTIKLLEALFKR
ncbi:Putative molybdenum carrier [Syntrophus gentianae]|uniref:Putative molybdenum carrier n=1 Tax=Syntrophus gentianae TaxID=43775 RepID=A0A1H7VEV6_9BACT|nr:putative molybdenum carrier protein [Syntrophus gentianae]SEM07445.1 Putative molybdenum carrier [Syntrophus gentianae]